MTLHFYEGAPSKAKFWRKRAQYWARSQRRWRRLAYTLNGMWALPLVLACVVHGEGWVIVFGAMVNATIQELVQRDSIRTWIAKSQRYEQEARDAVLWLEAGIIPPAWVAEYQDHQEAWR